MLRITLFSIFILLSVSGSSQKTSYGKQWLFPPKDSSMLISAEQQKELAASDFEMQWFKDAKLGIFVHWGPALHATNTLSWGRMGERPGANKAAKNGIPTEVYDSLYKMFNPVAFDADEWMQQVKDFGAQYLVFTAKHHDGFCMFDAPNTDYDIEHTPFKRDICRELSEAADRHGVRLFWYYSQPDWTHPDCLREKHYESYLPYMKEHIRHLFSNYGKISGIFWDGIASKYWQWDSYRLMLEMKAMQPGLLSNPRGGFGWPMNDQRGDFDTPEQSLGPLNHHRYWEACLTMTDKWLYSPKGPIKSSEGILGMLIQVAGNGGNLLLNLGPDGSGKFVQKETEEAYEVGKWLKEYGHTIYNTRRGIYLGGDYGASTQKNNKLYLHFLQKVANNATAVFELPELPFEVKSAKGISPGFQCFSVKNNKLVLTFDDDSFNQNLDNIVELTLKENPQNYERIPTWHAEPLSLKEITISASSFLSSKTKPEIIYKDKRNVFSEGIQLKSWWQPAKNDSIQELTLALNTPRNIKSILLSEHMRNHSVKKFEISTKYKKGQWKVIYSGNVIGEGLRIKLNGENISAVKLKILDSGHQPQITAFNIYE